MKPESPSKPQSGSVLLKGLPLLALGCLLLICIFGAGSFAALNLLGVVNVQVNLFRTPTPTAAAFLVTPTPGALPSAPATIQPTPSAAVETPAASPTPSADVPPTDAVPTPLDTPTAPSVTLPTPVLPETFLDFDADFIFGCDLFEGDNEERAYACDGATYLMHHKEATTRYAYYDELYQDAVIEAGGYWEKGQGKYEYGLVFRANDEGTLYYVFTVTNDGRYNVALYKDDQYTDLIPYTASPIVRIGERGNDFKVVMRGDRFDFFLNDDYLGSVTDATIASGLVGLFFYNGEPDVEVRFDYFTISTFERPAPTPQPTQSAPPGVYVSRVRMQPAAPKRREPVTFLVSFLNTTGSSQGYRWSVEIFNAENKSFGIADGKTQTIPTGSAELATEDSWRVTGGGPCLPFTARVIWIDDQNRRIPFTRPDGSPYWIPFQVCP